MGKIENILRELGIGANYKAFHILVATLDLVTESPDCLLCITKSLYPVVGERCGCSASAVEHNIRSASKRAWKLNSQRMCEIARYPLTGPPTAAEFIDILTAYISRQKSPSAHN